MRSGDAEKKGERAVDLKHERIVGLADDAPDPRDRDCGSDQKGRQIGEQIALHDKRGTRLAIVARCGDDDKLTTTHQPSGH